jgi:hypothetical protein
LVHLGHVLARDAVGLLAGLDRVVLQGQQRSDRLDLKAQLSRVSDE